MLIGAVSLTYELRRTFEGDDSDRTAGNTRGVTDEQKVRTACLTAVGDGV